MHQLSPVSHAAAPVEANRRPPFLSTHSALAACTRELARFGAEVVKQVGAALLADGTEVKPVARQSPTRCIVQLGPVALTATWLRATADSAAEGQLLIVVWRGSVAPQGGMQFERPADRRAPEPATSLWEEVYVAEAENEAGWRWQPQLADGASYPSPELAARCVEQLRREYERAMPAAVAVNGGAR